MTFDDADSSLGELISGRWSSLIGVATDCKKLEP